MLFAKNSVPFEGLYYRSGQHNDILSYDLTACCIFRLTFQFIILYLDCLPCVLGNTVRRLEHSGTHQIGNSCIGIPSVYMAGFFLT